MHVYQHDAFPRLLQAIRRDIDMKSVWYKDMTFHSSKRSIDNS